MVTTSPGLKPWKDLTFHISESLTHEHILTGPHMQGPPKPLSYNSPSLLIFDLYFFLRKEPESDRCVKGLKIYQESTNASAMLSSLITMHNN